MEEIQEKLKKLVLELFSLEIEPEVVSAPENTEADYASNIAMKLSKDLKRNPREIAEEIREKYGENVEVAGPGFLNFKLSNGYYLNKLGDFTSNFSKNISLDEYLDKNVICEFSDPNPFKVLHAGHLYTSVVGDAISRLFEYSGAKVTRANFGGDVGLHVAKTIYALLYTKDSSEQMGELKIEDIAKAYVEGTRAYEEDDEAKKKITELNKEIYRINKENIREGEVAEIYWKGRELSYRYFDDFYAKIGVKFDKYYPESSVAELGLKTVREQLKKGIYEVSDGAVVFDGEKFGLHTRVFINQEGVPTYETKDVGLIFTKWADYHFDKSVVITGNEQLDYMKVVLKSIEQYAPELVEKTAHLTHGLVKLPGNEKMSSRKGNFLKAVDVLDMVAQNMQSPAEEFEKLAENDKKIALSAVKYAFLKYKIGGDIIFDPKESVKMTGNSGPYLLYSAVRAKKILKNASNQSEITEEKGDLNEFEKKLIKKIVQYSEVLKEATNEMAPHKVCNYLYEVAQEFSRFYENCPVVGSESEAIRIKLVEMYLKTMEHGFNLLGIEVPDEM
ncbi:arginine--tRNA ligase [Candidatus Saccharibacteria bacterium]|nr:arginine--tRNA ligase [Candidatus Saccharibacteria bacterium]